MEELADWGLAWFSAGHRSETRALELGNLLGIRKVVSHYPITKSPSY